MEYTEREIRKTAQNLAHALSIIEGQKCSVHGFEFLQDSTVLAEFHISVGGVDYDGGSYEVMENGEIRNIAIRKSPSYATVGDGADAIVKRIVGEDLMGEESPLRNPLRENEVPFAKLFMGAEYSMLGGIREEFKDAESNLSEATLKRLRKTYDEYEDRNEHLSNYLLLATFFGTDSEKEEVKKIKARRDRRGHITQKESTWLYENINPYYDHLRNVKAAEKFNVEFNEWAGQEMLTHGQDISFRDWAKDEGKKHGNVPITDWAEHEEESHDERYGAESFGAESKKTKYGMIAAGVITAFALLPEIKKRF
jgi:hypothetical protein